MKKLLKANFAFAAGVLFGTVIGTVTCWLAFTLLGNSVDPEALKVILDCAATSP